MLLGVMLIIWLLCSSPGDNGPFNVDAVSVAAVLPYCSQPAGGAGTVAGPQQFPLVLPMQQRESRKHTNICEVADMCDSVLF